MFFFFSNRLGCLGSLLLSALSRSRCFSCSGCCGSDKSESTWKLASASCDNGVHRFDGWIQNPIPLDGAF